MADDSAERTEEPTAQRLSKAREEGQLARSVELPAAAMLITATLFFSLSGNYMFHRLGALFASQLQFDRKIMDKAELLPGIFLQSVVDGYLLILPIMALLAVVAGHIWPAQLRFRGGKGVATGSDTPPRG